MSDLYIILVVPIYNEASHLDVLLESLRSCGSYTKKTCFVAIDHGSTDLSRDIIMSYAGLFRECHILNEPSSIRSVGIPRSRGFKFGLSIANRMSNDSKTNCVIASIDCDSRVSSEFLGEIGLSVPKLCDVLVFPSKSDPIILQNWATIQTNDAKDIAIRSLFGLEWLKFHLHSALMKSGAFETRAPGGYAMTPLVLEKLKHEQPLDDSGMPISGESNRLGIMAHRLSLRMKSSPYVTLNHPRREIQAALSAETKGNHLNTRGDEIFIVQRSAQTLPLLEPNEWKKYLEGGTRRAIAMFLMRTISYGCFNLVEPFFSEHPTWKELLSCSEEYFVQCNPPLEETAVIGSAIFRRIINHATKTVGIEAFKHFVDHVIAQIPENSHLLFWGPSSESL